MVKKLSVSIMILVLSMSLTIAGVLAFFSDMDRTPVNRFNAGIVSIKADEILIPGPEEITDWTPGEPVKEDYEIINTGTVPIFLRTSFTGSWSPLTNVAGQHSNTATVTAHYKTQTLTAEDQAHYYVVENP